MNRQPSRSKALPDPVRHGLPSRFVYPRNEHGGKVVAEPTVPVRQMSVRMELGR